MFIFIDSPTLFSSRRDNTKSKVFEIEIEVKGLLPSRDNIGKLLGIFKFVILLAKSLLVL